MLKKIKGHDFLGTLYLLKCVLWNLPAWSKTFQAECLNFSRTTPSINRWKTKIQEIEKSGNVWDDKNNLWDQLKSLTITFTDIQENIIKSIVGKCANSISQNIYARFPSNQWEILTAFTIFDVDLVPTQYCATFSANGNKEISCLGKHVSSDSVLGQWNDFNFEMIKNDKNIATLRNQLQLNKIKFKNTSTEWTLEHILNTFKGEISLPMVT